MSEFEADDFEIGRAARDVTALQLPLVGLYSRDLNDCHCTLHLIAITIYNINRTFL